MKIAINQPIIGINGKEIINPDNSKMTLKDVCVQSILTPAEGDDEKKKFEKWEIYKKLRNAQMEVELKIEEVGLIKKCIGKLQPPLVMGQCFEMLEK